MSKSVFTNNAATTLASAVGTGDLSITLATGTGSLFPTPSGGTIFYITCVTATSTYEIMKVTARTSDTLTVVRAQEGTTALAFNNGDRVELRVTAASLTNMLQSDDIGVTVQAYDADTAKLDVEQTWSQVQRTNENIVTSLTLDLDGGYLDFRCTPSAGGALTFSNIPASPLVQKGTIRFINGSNYAITAGSGTKINATDLTKISATGEYILSYRTSNGNVYVMASGNVA